MGCLCGIVFISAAFVLFIAHSGDKEVPITFDTWM